MATFTETYYAYSVVFCGRYVKEDGLRFALATVFHMLFLLALWSYAQTAFTPPATVPHWFRFTPSERQELTLCEQDRSRTGALLETMANERGVLTRLPNGTVSCCDKCRLIKPDRCHHCSACKRCVPKMDHHCPWFNNCVCFSTYKFFLLTLFYSALLAAYVVASVSIYLLHKNSRRSLLHRPRHIKFLLVMGSTMSVALAIFIGLHISLVARNATSLESMRAPTFKQSGRSFNIGRYRNFVEVFGVHTFLWLVPVFTSLGDGCHFPTRLHLERIPTITIDPSQGAASVGEPQVTDAGAGGEAGPQRSIASIATKKSVSSGTNVERKSGCAQTTQNATEEAVRHPSPADSLEAVIISPATSDPSVPVTNDDSVAPHAANNAPSAGFGGPRSCRIRRSVRRLQISHACRVCERVRSAAVAKWLWCMAAQHTCVKQRDAGLSRLSLLSSSPEPISVGGSDPRRSFFQFEGSL
ncbi:hypothetical protein HPB50_013208 [Hyalomma asiaticum]|uniref:Uncharacterized protein n=1 Tax=Hyalomma asiaticum TaxID=266040 RepID=A0ACB7S2E7_HYAAI|nr:hypothetical protein HPB50_013208 [Hyalomma asiaticum]